MRINFLVNPIQHINIFDMHWLSPDR